MMTCNYRLNYGIYCIFWICVLHICSYRLTLIIASESVVHSHSMQQHSLGGATSASVENTAATHTHVVHRDAASKLLIVMSYPYYGHLHPPMTVAEELQYRGWRVIVTSTTEMIGRLQRTVSGMEQDRLEYEKNHVDTTDHSSASTLHPFMFYAIPECEPKNMSARMATASLQETPAEEVWQFATLIFEMYPCMVQAWRLMLSALKNGQRLPVISATNVANGVLDSDVYVSGSIDMVLVDAVTFPGLHTLLEAQVPFVRYNPLMLHSLSQDERSGSFWTSYLPLAGNDHVSIKELQDGTQDAFAVRLIHTLLVQVLKAALEVPFLSPLLNMQAQVDMHTTTFKNYAVDSPILQVGSIGAVEFPHAVPSHVNMVGLPLPVGVRRDLAVLQQGADYQESVFSRVLSSELKQWIDSSDTPVVFVSMGTVSAMKCPMARNLSAAFGAMQGRARFLWKIDRMSRDCMDNNELSLPSNVRLQTSWVQELVLLLAHPKVHAFVSHCGMNSVYESLYVGIPLLCVPRCSDQVTLSGHVREFGIGRSIQNRLNFQTPELVEHLEAILDDSFWGKSAQVSRIKLLRRGGTEAAADLVEFYTQHGYEHELPLRIPILTKGFYIWILCCVAILWCCTRKSYWSCCCCCCIWRRCCCRERAVSEKQKKQ
jgi:UDP:flavonoid glycosyltransferase YjiC (YdhE family)